jgi:MFS family permease
MSASVILRRHRRIVVLSTLLSSILLLLMQTGLWYVSVHTDQTLWWLIGTPLCSFLIGGQGAFWAMGSLVSRRARRKGALIGIGSVILAALILLLLSIWWVEDAQPSPHRIPLLNLFIPPGIVYIEAFFGAFLVFFLIINLLSIALAPLGGMVGGYLRTHRSQEHQGGQKDLNE